eukprot:TRINITY_DN2483_c0_g1_i3.p1 TRINITY_DN2483_c0_g1~~TRINITY_DN2483_c0_g1_i3.p1  ORF type:complete len:597 (+),score=80.76 TRINITY_DN2483_c0_g1_i3:435-2225(+)
MEWSKMISRHWISFSSSSLSNSIRFNCISILLLSSYDGSDQLSSQIPLFIIELSSNELFESFQFIPNLVIQLKSSCSLYLIKILSQCFKFEFFKEQLSNQMDDISTLLCSLVKTEESAASVVVQSCIENILQSNNAKEWFNFAFEKVDWNEFSIRGNEGWIYLLEVYFSRMNSKLSCLSEHHLLCILPSLDIPNDLGAIDESKMAFIMEWTLRIIKFGDLPTKNDFYKHENLVNQISLHYSITELICKCSCFASFIPPIKGEEDSWSGNFHFQKLANENLFLIWNKYLNQGGTEQIMDNDTKINQLLSYQCLEIMEYIYKKMVPLSMPEKRDHAFSSEEKMVGWRRNAHDKNAFFWILKQIKSPFIGLIAQKGISVCLAVLNDYDPKNKRKASDVLNHVMGELSITEIRWFSELVFLHISSNIPLLEDPATLASLLSCAIRVLSTTEITRPKLKHHSLFELVLFEIEKRIGRLSNNLRCLIPLLFHLEQLVISIGIETVKHFNKFFPIVYQLLSWVGDSFQYNINDEIITIGGYCINILRSICVQCWPRISTHQNKIEMVSTKFEESLRASIQWQTERVQSLSTNITQLRQIVCTK